MYKLSLPRVSVSPALPHQDFQVHSSGIRVGRSLATGTLRMRTARSPGYHSPEQPTAFLWQQPGRQGGAGDVGSGLGSAMED